MLCLIDVYLYNKLSQTRLITKPLFFVFLVRLVQKSPPFILNSMPNDSGTSSLTYSLNPTPRVQALKDPTKTHLIPYIPLLFCIYFTKTAMIPLNQKILTR